MSRHSLAFHSSEVAREVTSKCLTCKHEDCSLIHRPHARELGVGLRTCNSSTREADTGGLAKLLGLGMMRLSKTSGWLLRNNVQWSSGHMDVHT